MSDIRYNGWLHRSGTGGVWQDSSGRVGIGSSVPTKLLELKGTDPTIKLWDSSGDAYALVEGDSADQGSLRFRADPTSVGGSTHIRFDVDGTEKLRIGTGGGGLSIGISTDTNMVTNSEVLCVRGYSSFKSGSKDYAALYIGNEGNTTDNINALILFNQNGANRSGIGYVPNTGEFRINNQYYTTFCTGGTSLAGTERLRIREDGRVSIASSLAVAGVCTAATFVPTEGQLGHRNLIINGAMQVAQRGTTGTTSGIVTVDRWYGAHSGTNEAPTQAQHTLTSSDTGPWAKGFRKSFHITNGNQTGGAGAGDYINIQTRLEAQDFANSGWDYASTSSYITLSFWVKSSVAQNFYGYLKTIDGTGQGYPFETGSLSANTWTKITKTIPGNSNITIDNNNEQGFQVNITPFWGTNYTDSGTALNTWAAYAGGTRTPDSTSTWYTTNDATFEITGVQLEVGSAATPFEHKTYNEDLRACQRYFWGWINPTTKIGFANGWQRTSDMTMCNLRHPVEMRASPTLATSTDTGDFSAVWLNTGGDINSSGITTPGGTYDRKFTYPIAATLDSGSLGSAGVGLTIENDGTLTFNAEL